jgi:hypothetical protein
MKGFKRNSYTIKLEPGKIKNYVRNPTSSASRIAFIRSSRGNIGVSMKTYWIISDLSSKNHKARDKEIK